MNVTKNFRSWFVLKPHLDNLSKRLAFKEREVWYCHWGTNIGFELDGKKQHLRPCLVIKKLSKETFYAIPLTSKLKDGSWYYPSHVQNKRGRYIFSQMKLVDAKRFKYFVETISEKEFNKVKQAFKDFF